MGRGGGEGAGLLVICKLGVLCARTSVEAGVGHSPIGEPLSLLALENVTIKGHTQEKIKGTLDRYRYKKLMDLPSNGVGRQW